MKVFVKENIERIRQFLLIALFSFPILSIKLINIFFIVFAVLTLFTSIKEKHKFDFGAFKKYGLFIVLFLPYLIEYIFFTSNTVMQFEFEKKLLFLFAPLAFYLNENLESKFKIEYAVNTFISAVVILSVIVIVNLLFWGNLFDKATYLNGAFELRKLFEEVSGQHPIYYGLFSTTASLWIVYYFDRYSIGLKWLLGVSLFFIVLLNLLIAAKMPLLILFIGLMWIAYKKMTNKKSLFLLYISACIVLISVSLLIPSLRSRLMEIPNYFQNQNPYNTLIERTIIFNCSKSIFIQDFLTGIGARNTQGLIDYCYIWIKFNKGLNAHFNSHNQFLTFGINYGIGFLIVFISLLAMIYKKVKSYPLGFIFLFSTIFIMLTESILERQMGIYYFLFFGLLFVNTIYNKKVTIANPK